MESERRIHIKCNPIPEDHLQWPKAPHPKLEKDQDFAGRLSQEQAFVAPEAEMITSNKKNVFDLKNLCDI